MLGMRLQRVVSSGSQLLHQQQRAASSTTGCPYVRERPGKRGFAGACIRAFLNSDRTQKQVWPGHLCEPPLGLCTSVDASALPLVKGNTRPLGKDTESHGLRGRAAGAMASGATVSPLAKYKLVRHETVLSGSASPDLTVDKKIVQAHDVQAQVFLGDQSVGKTSIITRFMYDKFDNTYQARPELQTRLRKLCSKLGLLMQGA